MAKDLVRTRANIQKFHRMKSQLQAVSLRIQTIKSTAAMANAMSGAARVGSCAHNSSEMQKDSFPLSPEGHGSNEFLDEFTSHATSDDGI